jgi:hypothetical protein
MQTPALLYESAPFLLQLFADATRQQVLENGADPSDEQARNLFASSTHTELSRRATIPPVFLFFLELFQLCPLPADLNSESAQLEVCQQR